MRVLRGVDPDRLAGVVAILTADLDRPDRQGTAAELLGNLGPYAHAALPRPEALAAASSGHLRDHVTLAVQTIRPPPPAAPRASPGPWLLAAAVLLLVALVRWALRRSAGMNPAAR